MNATTKGHLALSISGLLFAINYWLAKELMPDFTPLQVVAFRLIVVTLLFWIVGCFSINKAKINKRDLIVLFIAGILGITLNQSLFFIGLENSSPIEASILHTLSPLLVALFAVLILKEKIKTRVIIGIFIGLISSLIFIIAEKEVSFYNKHLVGNLFIIGNIISYSLYLVILKPIMAKYDTIQVLKYIFLFGLIALIPFIPKSFEGFNFNEISYIKWIYLAFVIFGATFTTYFLTNYGLKLLPVTVVGYYVFLQPVLATFIGFIFGIESMSIIKVIAVFFLFVGVYLVVKKR